MPINPAQDAAFILLHASDPPECLAACAARFAAVGIAARILDMRAAPGEALPQSGEAAPVPADLPLALPLIRPTAAAWEQGYAACLNEALESVRHTAPPAVFLCRADAVPEEHCLPALQAALAQQPDMGAVGCRTVSPTGRVLSEGRSFFNGRGFNSPGVDRNFSLPEPFSEPEPFLRPAAPVATPALPVDGLSPALVYVRWSALEAVEGFDPAFRFPWLFLDDFCTRLRRAGFGAGFVPSATAIWHRPHHFPGIAPALPQHADLLGHLNGVADRFLRLDAPAWAARWGWHPLYPDMAESRRRVAGQSSPESPLRAAIEQSLKSPLTELPCRVDLCMVTWNSRGVLGPCLDSLAATDYPMDLLTLFVADNGSTDGTPDYILERAADLPFKVELTRLPVNSGAVAAMNAAFQQGSAPVLAKLDDDIRVSPGWLRALLRHFTERPFAAVSGPKVLDDSPEGHIQCGPILQPPLYCEAEGEIDEGQYDYVCRVLHVRGCCCLYRRDALQRVGPLDIRFSPTQFDDLDHHIRFVEAGYDVIYDGTTHIYHKLTSGAYLTLSAIGNVQGHGRKLQYKWGQETMANMELALTLSATGRLLSPDLNPDDRLPGSDNNAAARPAIPTPAVPGNFADQFSAHEADVQRTRAASSLYMDVAREQWNRGFLKAALKSADSGLALNPADAALLALYADIAETMGQLPLARRSRARAELLGWREIEQSGNACPIEAQSGNFAVSAPENAAPLPVGDDLKGLRLLLAAVPGLPHEVSGVLLPYLGALAAAQGADVTLWNGKMGDLQAGGAQGGRFDVAHVFGLHANPSSCLDLLKGIQAGRRVLSPLLRDEGRAHWAEEVLPRLFVEHLNAPGAPDMEALLRLLASDGPIYGLERGMPASEAWPGHSLLCSVALALADTVTCGSALERELAGSLAQVRALETLYTAAPFARPARARAGESENSPSRGQPPYILTIGPLSPTDGLPVLLLAAHLVKLPVLWAGAACDPQYLKLCQALAPEGSRFAHSPSPAELHQLLAGAAVYARNSLVQDFPDYAPAAAALGVPVLGSPTTLAAEILGRAAAVVPPLDAQALAAALRLLTAESGGQSRARDLRNAARAANGAALAQQLATLYR